MKVILCGQNYVIKFGTLTTEDFLYITLRQKYIPPKAGFLMPKEWWEVNFFENLILVQDERWRRALSMQIERAGGQNSEVGGRIMLTWICGCNKAKGVSAGNESIPSNRGNCTKIAERIRRY